MEVSEANRNEAAQQGLFSISDFYRLDVARLHFMQLPDQRRTEINLHMPRRGNFKPAWPLQTSCESPTPI
jgi:hypothetical protein